MERNPYRVFLSYPGEDRATADRIAARLEASGVSVFRDSEAIPLGAEINDTIQSALDDSEAVVIVLTSNLKRSPWVGRELTRALRSHPDRPVIPILVGDGATENVVWPILSDRQALQAGDRLEEKDLDAITHAIQNRIALGSGAAMGAFGFGGSGVRGGDPVSGQWLPCCWRMLLASSRTSTCS